MKDFKVEDAVVEKFKVVENPEKEERTPIEPAPEEVVTTKAKPIPPIKKAIPSVKRVAKKEEINSIKKEIYPDDYPAELIKFDHDSKKAWDVFKARVIHGEKAAYSITYAGIDTGSITLETKQNTAKEKNI